MIGTSPSRQRRKKTIGLPDDGRATSLNPDPLGGRASRRLRAILTLSDWSPLIVALRASDGNGVHYRTLEMCPRKIDSRRFEPGTALHVR
jgi:hypothetical protein